MIEFFCDFVVDELYLDGLQGSITVDLSTGDGRCSCNCCWNFDFFCYLFFWFWRDTLTFSLAQRKSERSFHHWRESSCSAFRAALHQKFNLSVYFFQQHVSKCLKPAVFSNGSFCDVTKGAKPHSQLLSCFSVSSMCRIRLGMSFKLETEG